MNPLKRPTLALLLAAGTLVLANCTVNTPQARIAEHQGLYDSLPAKHQELVNQGRIDKGMSTAAVFLAWGNPKRKSEGYRHGATYKRWDYTRLQPVAHHSFFSYWGSGYGRHRHRYRYSGFGYSPSVEYVPYRSATVWFKKGVVDSWERVSPYQP